MKKNKDDKTPIKFSPEQEQAIREGLRGFDKLEGMSAEEAHELARIRTKAWMEAAPQDLSA